MELIFESTKGFERDLKKFNKKEQSFIIDKINWQANVFLEDKNAFFKQQNVRPLINRLKNGLEPSLYTISLSKKVRVIITIDEDPLFDQIIITLFRVVGDNDYHKGFNSIAKSLYQKDLFD